MADQLAAARPGATRDQCGTDVMYAKARVTTHTQTVTPHGIISAIGITLHMTRIIF
jgi:hypothetical protein